MDSLDKPAGKPKIVISLEYRCFPVWFYDENNELIENDLPEDLKDNSKINSLCDEIQRIYDSLYINNDTEFTYRGFKCEDDRKAFSEKLSQLKKLLRENVGEEYEIGSISDSDEDEGIKININLRDKSWKKGILASVMLLVIALFILVLGLYTKETVAIVIGGIGTVLFGFFVYLMANTSQHVSMQMVKGEMSYKQLKDTIAQERFEKPIQFLYGAGKPYLFLVSDDWVVLGDKIGTPVYIPKYKVKSIEVRSDTLDISDDESWDGQEHQAPYFYLRFKCDDKHIFECGLIRPNSINRVLNVLSRYFPLGDMEVHTTGKDDQQ